jgi:hypothetical protein
MAKSIKVNGPYKVSTPYDFGLDGFKLQLYPVLNKGVGSAIAWCPTEATAHWVANALNMLKAIEDAAILQNAEMGPDASTTG